MSSRLREHVVDDVEEVLKPQALKLRIACVQRLAEDNNFVHTASTKGLLLNAQAKKAEGNGVAQRMDATRLEVRPGGVANEDTSAQVPRPTSVDENAEGRA